MADPAEQDNPEDIEARPDWLPDNFANPEALAASYKEAQKKITEETSARKALEANYADLAAQVEQLRQPAEPQYDPNDLAAQYGLEPEQLQLMAQLASQAAQLSVQQYQQQQAPAQQSQTELVAAYAEQTLSSKHEDFGAYASKVADELRAKPWLYPDDARTSPQKAVEAIETVYNLVKANELFSGAAEQQITAADLMQRMKLQAQTAPGADGRPAPADPGANRWQEITDAKTVRYEDLFK